MPSTKIKLSFFRGYIFRIIALIILGLLFFEFYVFLKVTRDNSGDDKKYVRDYETVLCSFSRAKKTYETRKAPCPVQGIVTTFRQGQLANNMWQYANVIATAMTTGLDPYIPACMREALEEVFSNVSVPLLSEIGHCSVSLPDSAATVEDWMDVGQSIVIRTGDLFGEIVMKYLEFIRGQFVFKPEMKDIARRHLLAAKPNDTTNVTYVGVYITKTSIIVNQEYDDVYPSVQFFVDAVNHFRNEYPNAVFVVITDRKQFWEYIFGTANVYVLDEDTLTPYGATLALLSHCNHSILASDDLAVWGAILSGGKAVVSLCLSDDFSGLMQFKMNWNYLLNNTKSLNKFLDRLF